MAPEVVSNQKSPKPNSVKMTDSKRLFVHIKDPENHDQLLKLKKTLNRYPGSVEAILVLGDNVKSALKLPFRVRIDNGLQSELIKLLTNDCVVVK
jgi:hypothetical protein